jgi:hypothetical protein
MSQVRDASLEDEPAGVDVVHPGDLDRHAVVGVVPVVQDDEGVGAVGADPNLPRCGKGVAGADEGPVLAAGGELVGIHLADIDLVTLRRVEVGDDIEVPRT